MPFLLEELNSLWLILPDAIFKQTSSVRSEALTSESTQKVGGSFWRTTSNRRLYSEYVFPKVLTNNLALIGPTDADGFDASLELQRKVPKMLVKKGDTSSFCCLKVRVPTNTGPGKKQ